MNQIVMAFGGAAQYQPVMVGIDIKPDDNIPDIIDPSDTRFIIPRNYDNIPIGPINLYILVLAGRGFGAKEQREIENELFSEEMKKKISESTGFISLVIWFTDEENNCDATRCEMYADKLNIKEFNLKSPYLVFLDKHPDNWDEGEKPAVISFNRLQPKRLGTVLSTMCDDLRKNNIPNLDNRIKYEALRKWCNDHQKLILQFADTALKFFKSS